jgi:uncharacterized protein HemX
MPRPRIPFRRRPPSDSEPEPPTAVASETQRTAAPTPRSGTAKPPAAQAGTAQAAPPGARPDPHERIDGLRAWLAQIDRKLGVRTYLLVAIAVLALAAAVVALVLVLQLKRDAATESDVSSIRDQLSGIQQSATQAAQRGVQSLNRRLGDLESEVGRLSTQETTSKRELQVVQDDIKELRSEVSSSSQGSTGTAGAAGTSGGTGAAPGTGASGGTGTSKTGP